MTPVISYWSSDDLLWMDGKGSDGRGPCTSDHAAACSHAAPKLYGFSVQSCGGPGPAVGEDVGGNAEVGRAAAPGKACPGKLAVAGTGEVALVGAQWNKPAQAAGRVGVHDGVVAHMGGRAYFGTSCSSGHYHNTEYAAFRLLGMTLRYTVDLSGAACGCNAAVYLTSLRQNGQLSSCSDYYCDANKVCGVSCAEIDIQEANRHAFYSTLHTADDGVGVGKGYGADRSTWNASVYGPGASCIDTSEPFEVSASFPVDEMGVLLAMEVRLSQHGKPCPLSLSIDNYHPFHRDGMIELSQALLEGMTPVISYWGVGEDMLWMDGRGAGGQGPCDISHADSCADSVRLYGFSVHSIERAPPLRAATTTTLATTSSPPTAAVAAAAREGSLGRAAARGAEGGAPRPATVAAAPPEVAPPHPPAPGSVGAAAGSAGGPPHALARGRRGEAGAAPAGSIDDQVPVVMTFTTARPAITSAPPATAAVARGSSTVSSSLGPVTWAGRTAESSIVDHGRGEASRSPDTAARRPPELPDPQAGESGKDLVAGPSRYKFVGFAGPEEARRACGPHMRLAMPKAPNEHTALLRAVSDAVKDGRMSRYWPNNTIWIGGHWSSANGDWEWDDGTPITLLNWAPGQPSASQAQDREPWLCMVSDGHVHDSDPPYSFGVVCEAAASRLSVVDDAAAVADNIAGQASGPGAQGQARTQGGRGVASSGATSNATAKAGRASHRPPIEAAHGPAAETEITIQIHTPCPEADGVAVVAKAEQNVMRKHLLREATAAHGATVGQLVSTALALAAVVLATFKVAAWMRVRSRTQLLLDNSTWVCVPYSQLHTPGRSDAEVDAA